MRAMNEKALSYLKGNPIVSEFIEQVNSKISTYYAKNLTNLTPKHLTLEVGNKFLKLWMDSTCWGFISRIDGDFKGAPIKKGDLLKPASWKAPAKHARGNIIDGTAQYDVHGPSYL